MAAALWLERGPAYDPDKLSVKSVNLRCPPVSPIQQPNPMSSPHQMVGATSPAGRQAVRSVVDLSAGSPDTAALILGVVMHQHQGGRGDMGRAGSVGYGRVGCASGKGRGGLDTVG